MRFREPSLSKYVVLDMLLVWRRGLIEIGRMGLVYDDVGKGKGVRGI